jgi:hypothetical protein
MIEVLLVLPPSCRVGSAGVSRHALFGQRGFRVVDYKVFKMVIQPIEE